MNRKSNCLRNTKTVKINSTQSNQVEKFSLRHSVASLILGKRIHPKFRVYVHFPAFLFEEILGQPKLIDFGNNTRRCRTSWHHPSRRRRRRRPTGETNVKYRSGKGKNHITRQIQGSIHGLLGPAKFASGVNFQMRAGEILFFLFFESRGRKLTGNRGA